jgi:hypothetical protein
VAAGSERLGFLINGPPCWNAPMVWADNYAHSSLVGVLLKANTLGSNCTWLNKFTMNLNWDFGVVTMQVGRKSHDGTENIQLIYLHIQPTKLAPSPFAARPLQGIPTDVLMTGVVAADNKHAGISILRKSNMTEPGQVGLNGGLIIGQSDPYMCGLCVNRREGGTMDPGCAPKMVPRGNNKNSPFTPARGLVSSVFATAFVPGALSTVLR